MNALVIFSLLAVLMLTGMPISISLGLTVLTFLFTMTQVPLESVALKLFTGIEKFEIMAIPFFILAGNFLTHGGVAKRMINFATSMVGHWYGGLGLAGVMACALFAAVSGSSPATVVAIGSILLPAMVKAGFPNKFGAGVISTSGALGILIPPSIVMVMYSVATNTSVGALFMAGVIPGLLLAATLGGVTWYRAKKFDYPRQPKASWGERFIAFRKSAWGLFLIVGLILFMGRRVIPFFIEVGVGYPVKLFNSNWLDVSIILFYIAFFIEEVLVRNPWMVALTSMGLFVANSVRLAGWHTKGIWKKPLLWSLFIAFIWINLGFLLLAVNVFLNLPNIVVIHAFSVGGIGVVILSMMARVTLGHTGRNVQNPPKAVAIALMVLVAGAVVRVIAPLVAESHYVVWVAASQVLWIAAFSIFIATCFPMLVKPRTDGQFG
jgi:hypothetical protein